MFGIGFPEIFVVLLILIFWIGLAAAFLFAVYYVVRKAVREETSSKGQ